LKGFLKGGEGQFAGTGLAAGQEGGGVAAQDAGVVEAHAGALEGGEGLAEAGHGGGGLAGEEEELAIEVEGAGRAASQLAGLALIEERG